MATQGLGTNSDAWYKALYEECITVTPESLSFVLKALNSSSDNSLFKENLLNFVQDSAQVLSEEPITMEHTFNTLQKLVYNKHESTAVRSQALITQTALSIELESLHTPAPQLENLVELLLELCAYRPGVGEAVQEKPKIDLPPTISEQRLLRSTACRCLQELEEAYPGLMCSSLSSLVEWLQLENSHVLQDLVSLAAAVLLHGVAQLIAQRSTTTANNGSEINTDGSESEKTDDKAGGDDQEESSGPSSFQGSLNWRPSSVTAAAAAAAEAGLRHGGTIFGLDKKLVDTLQMEVLSAVGNLYSTITDLPDWGILRLVSLLAPLSISGLVPAATLLPHCTRFAHSSSPLLLFLAADLTGASPSMKPLVEDVVSGLVSIADSPTAAIHWRTLSISWLGTLAKAPELWGSSSGRVAPVGVLRRIAQGIAPSAGSEPFEMREARLCALTQCFSTPPESICDVLVCMHEFRSYKPDSLQSLQFFNVICHWIVAFPGLFDTLFRNIVMKDAVRDSGHAKGILHLIDALPESVSKRLLGVFAELLPDIPPAYLPAYLPIVERLVMDENSDAGSVLNAIKGLLTRTGFCTNETWTIGCNVLSICKTTLLNHRLADILGPLGEILAYIVDNCNDLDIRDRAAFYLELVTHVPAHSIHTILTAEMSSDNALLFSTQARQTQELNAIDLISETFIPAASGFIELVRRDTDSGSLPFPAEPYVIKPTFSSSKQGDEQDQESGSEGEEKDTSKGPLETYFDGLEDCDVGIRLQGRLRYKSGKTATTSNTIYDISVSMEHNSQSGIPFYNATKNIYTPYLRAVEQDEAQGSFPYCCDDTIEFVPTVPLPGNLVPYVTFNDATGKIYTSELDPVGIRMEDLFLPIQSKELAEIAPEDVYPLLWEHLGSMLAESSETTKEETTTGGQEETPTEPQEAGGESQEQMAAQIVKLLRLTPQEVTEMVSRKMERFVVKSEGEGSVVDLGIFLPPSFHLLIKVVPHEHETCLAYIRTDFWYILAYIDSLIDIMFS